ncbi:hypothetical protein COU89_00470 [Candidatus Roizmanbacteria bacterium CG10_big_fil_rev_8_21_14_0_10_45_7]|uniref:Uncharacterized protein n=1 Tax=Candidatus Roizmanbacteria bacterium CG10_big_fil_rev_8_21_14_0_10_45_7 TaxID=1974854 RepID=A0A2M8KVM2_9BACT|nr:MAG: hypothetical protein COU89_00470 [Candidatus Roizmanbacteria bacterium CG10_big_fil_rev_8_21_14_0_10_45_7]
MVDFIDRIDASFQKLPAKTRMGIIACIGAAVVGLGCNPPKNEVRGAVTATPPATTTPRIVELTPTPSGTPTCEQLTGMDRIKAGENGSCSCVPLKNYPVWTAPAGACTVQ